MVAPAFLAAEAVDRRHEHAAHNPVALKAEGHAAAIPGGSQEGAARAYCHQDRDLR